MQTPSDLETAAEPVSERPKQAYRTPSIETRPLFERMAIACDAAQKDASQES